MGRVWEEVPGKIDGGCMAIGGRITWEEFGVGITKPLV